jgi:hypothetical protein
MGRIGMAAVSALVLAGCFSKPGFTAGGDDAPPDDAAIDAPGSCTAMVVRCVTPTELETCAAAGAEPQIETCPWTCTALGSGPHCRSYRPAGTTLTSIDLMPAGNLSAVTVSGGSIDGTTGEISGVRPSGPGVKAGIDFEIRSNVGVFRFQSLTLAGSIELRGSLAIALVADGAITVDGIIDGTTGCSTTGITAGGAGGGMSNTSAVGFGAGQGGGADNDMGGAGGGHGTTGGNGGRNTGAVAMGGAVFAFTELRGGGGGGGGNGTGGAGGAGGAAIQLASNHAVTITANGGINAGGCSGRQTTTNAPGGGGGAGGLIVIEGNAVIVQGKLAVNGGGGSAGEAGASVLASHGLLARAIASGATALTGVGHGGGGGYGAAGQPAALLGQTATVSSSNGGGGGGGIGRIVINTADGQVVGTGLMSPAFTDAGTTATKGLIVAQ